MSKANILVVDDQDSIRHFVGKALEEDGYTVMTTGSLRETRQVLEREIPDLAILDFKLPDGTVVRVVRAPHFLATKLQAYIGRGNGDPLGSRDVEDILSVIDGRSTLLDEVRRASPDLQAYIAGEISKLLVHKDFGYAVQACAGGDRLREEFIFERLQTLTNIQQ